MLMLEVAAILIGGLFALAYFIPWVYKKYEENQKRKPILEQVKRKKGELVIFYTVSMIIFLLLLRSEISVLQSYYSVGGLYAPRGQGLMLLEGIAVGVISLIILPLIAYGISTSIKEDISILEKKAF